MSLDDVHTDVPDTDEQLVALLGADLRSARDGAPLPMLGNDLAAIFADGLPPVASPAAPAPSPRRRTLRRVLVAAGAVVVGTGGLGVAGALPAPVQGAVADVADVVGIDLPEPEEAPAVPVIAEEPATTTTEAPTTTTTATPPTTARPTPPSTVPPVLEEDPHDRGRGEERREEVRSENAGGKKTEVEAKSSKPAVTHPAKAAFTPPSANARRNTACPASC